MGWDGKVRRELRAKMGGTGWNGKVRRELRAKMGGTGWDETVRRELRANMGGTGWHGKVRRELRANMGGMDEKEAHHLSRTGAMKQSGGSKDGKVRRKQIWEGWNGMKKR